jgi:two-component system, chemotaxis family, protein-glutamate methylesterase/glutaminase
MIRVLVAEDSPTARALLVGMLESDPELQVVAQARDGIEAVEMAERVRPDLITMDVQMPRMDGLTATQAIMSRFPTPIIVVSSQADRRQAELSLEATSAGALIVLPKPVGPNAPGFAAQRDQLVSMAKAMAKVKVVRRWSSTGGRTATPSSVPRFTGRTPAANRTQLIAIGASTGGPAALRDIFAALPQDFPVPIVVAQHIAKGFVGALAHWLDGAGKIAVTVATEGQQLRPANVYLAPDDAHLGVRASRDGAFSAALSQAPAVGSFRPSATHLFQSVATASGAATTAVILTGMGDDGVRGLAAVRAAGGQVIAQDEASCVIYGMPREAVRAGVVDIVAPLADIAACLVQVVA